MQISPPFLGYGSSFIRQLIHSFVHSLNIYKLLTLCKAVLLPRLIQKSIWIYRLFHTDLFYLLPKGKDEV